ncbi:hypothetical protein B0A48_16567 [Cryoendolithus antarcticus]|uniref:Translation initiation factor eIF4e n=1 Tax=Cryoendolithus antarcticus TaxID=1507870 RepID=A0A1V8SE14_9PEZI|nr:hypothetical protein B0A48_16567 [Cryoendolithus antarcticus]
MAAPPHLNLPSSPPTTSPARGAEMREFLTSRLRTSRISPQAQPAAPQQPSAPPLVHAWTFWHDRQDRSAPQSTSNATPDHPSDYEDRLVPLASIADVAAFWGVLNNFDISLLPLRDSIHLFKRGVKPLWEDPRNAKGGAWTFRVPKSQAPEWWKEVCMMAVGEQLQAAVAGNDEGEGRGAKDDICGISLGVRFNSCLLQVWNRDGEHSEGIQRVLESITAGLSAGLGMREGSFYYKRHAEHASFAKTVEGSTPMTGAASSNPAP